MLIFFLFEGLGFGERERERERKERPRPVRGLHVLYRHLNFAIISLYKKMLKRVPLDFLRYMYNNGVI